MKHKTPIQSIKAYCRFDCCAGDLKSWKGCSRTVCPLYSYRLGKRPKPDIKPQASDKKQVDSTILSSKIGYSTVCIKD